ncbi:conjugal transfer protein TraP [Hafnia alvei]|uniref:conjugal transfer protein TraP n=1 Tax=Hafnia alvei TaxID=569 RepID=UPI001411D925|nr:conjugal transfer protein TraP [Hafnia alvei]QIP58274.1 TraP protein [Hafnia alvei]
MDKYRVSLFLSLLRWVKFLILYAVIYPSAMMSILVALVLWMGLWSPGQMRVAEIESVQKSGYTINDCSSVEGQLSDEPVKPLVPSLLQKNCHSVPTDAAGYAANIDRRSRANFLKGWLMLALVFMVGAVAIGRAPSIRFFSGGADGH